jgi:arabinan endo-1,5-alpha-L-arabinosidase
MLSITQLVRQGLLAVAALSTNAQAQYPLPGVVTGDTRVHDPTVVKTPSGSYIMAHTGHNLALKTSSDRTAWRDAGAVFPSGASWTLPYTNGDLNLWAPDISYHNGQYYLYYSASSFGQSRSAIFLATSSTGASGSWTNQGLVIESTTTSNYNCIDPNLFVDSSGQWWLSFGSFWSGLKMVAVSSGTGMPTDGTIIDLASRPNAAGALEAPFITQRGSYFYLWMSFDSCCQGASSTYRTMVGRATSITAPFFDRDGRSLLEGGGTELLASHGNIRGPGHPAVLADGDGDVLVYHYYDGSNGVALLGINLVRYESDWPVVY